MENQSIARIANPIYDVVFRYMMEDNKVAKLFLSAIIGKEIIDLKFRPTAHSTKIGETNSITVIRMDFSARIKDDTGREELVLIELQKAKFYFQTMRFRRYLGRQYQNKENVDQHQNPLPLLPIYILGDAFTKQTSPVIKVNRNYKDCATGANIQEKHPFIEALTHNAIIIQIPHLKGHRRTVLERFLGIFDQSLREDNSGHILNLEVNDYPDRYRPVIRRLIKALQNPSIEADMDMEDEVINEFNKQAELITKAERKAKEEQKRAEEARKNAEEARKRAEEEKKRAQNEQDTKERLIRGLYENNMTIEQIVALSGLTYDEVKAILS